MFRNIATIGFICLSAGSFAAEKAPDQSKVENATIKKALVDLLNERSAWGSSPTQSTAVSTAATNRLALENYLAVRDSWGRGPDAAPSNSNARALSAYLARRDSWGSGPQAASNPHASALAAYLARRDAWGSAPAVTVADTGPALKAYLARRASWGSRPDTVASNPNAIALSAYLARRERWGSAPATKTNTISIALSRLLRERASWGTHPVISSAEANMPQTATALADYLERRASWNKAEATRVAAFTMTRPARPDAPTCTEALGQITGSGRISFAFGSAGLTNEGSGRLSQVAATARDCTGFRIRIEGHTDASGDAAINQALSEARAAAVADYLQAAGIDAAALEAVGFGESQPLVPNTSRANRAQNRRIKLSVLTN